MSTKEEKGTLNTAMCCIRLLNTGAHPTTVKSDDIMNTINIIRESKHHTRKIIIHPSRSGIILDDPIRYNFNISRIKSITINKLNYRILDIECCIEARKLVVCDIDIYRNKEYDLYIYKENEIDAVDCMEIIYDGSVYTLKYKVCDEYVDILNCDILFHLDYDHEKYSDDEDKNEDGDVSDVHGLNGDHDRT